MFVECAEFSLAFLEVVAEILGVEVLFFEAAFEVGEELGGCWEGFVEAVLGLEFVEGVVNG